MVSVKSCVYLDVYVTAITERYNDASITFSIPNWTQL